MRQSRAPRRQSPTTAAAAARSPRRRSQKADSTRRSSQAVPHPSTNRALCRLTSEVRRDPVHSTRYGRQRLYCCPWPHIFEWPFTGESVRTINKRHTITHNHNEKTTSAKLIGRLTSPVVSGIETMQCEEMAKVLQFLLIAHPCPESSLQESMLMI